MASPALLRARSLAWHRADDINHGAVEGETRLLLVADHDEGFGPGFDREVLGTYEEGCWRDSDGFRLGPIVAVSPAARRVVDCAATIPAEPSAEALALAASMHGLRTPVACLGGALFVVGGLL